MLTEPLENGRSSSPQRRKAVVFQVLKFQNIFLLHFYSYFVVVVVVFLIPLWGEDSSLLFLVTFDGSLFYIEKHFRTLSFGIYETHNSIICSAWVLVWQVVHAVTSEA